MRRSYALAVAALAVASAPCAGLAEEAAAAPAAAPAAEAPEASTPSGREDAREAAASGLPLPGSGDPLPRPTIAQPAAPPAAPAPSSSRPLPLLGLAIGGGFPDLANLNLLFRPVRWLRLYGGPSWSSVSWGAQAGLLVAPWNGPVTPTLSLQAGTLFGTSLTRFVKGDSRDLEDVRPLLADVDYRYLAGDLGVELGSPRGLSFYLRLGLSIVAIRANGRATHTADDGTRVTLRDPSVTAWLPSAKLGFQYWF